ncbi:MAG: holo-ACP synthase [Brockia lithotrophica]|nr:holo-ACP synthase [Brockia lithotrophica]
MHLPPAIVGIGVDIVDNRRIAELLARKPRLVARLLAPCERGQLPSDPRRHGEFLAGRFALKEATAKALGTGIGGRLRFHDVRVFRDPSGAPLVELSPEARHRFPVLLYATLSHERNYSVAFVLALRSDGFDNRDEA